MAGASNPSVQPLDDTEIAALQALLDAVPAPLEPFDLSALDGFLCAVIVQPRPVPERAWWPRVLDVDGRSPSGRFDPAPLRALVRRRHGELAEAIGRRRWFDPWVFAHDGDDSDGVAAVGAWAAGFAIALETFPELLGSDDPATTAPLALVYRHLGADHLEDADDLLEAIDELAAPVDLGAAVEEMVRATLLLADAAGLPAQRPRAARRPTP